MKHKVRFLTISIFLILLSATLLTAQFAKREDAIWARSTTESMILDGQLNETSWASAESLHVAYGESTGLPSSGWTQDPSGGPGAVTDPTNATVKFLVTPDNYLYVGFRVPDSSIGGSKDWANWDGILLSLKSRITDAYLTEFQPTTPLEYFYSYWYANDSFSPGDPPVFRGTFGTDDVFPKDSAAFNAAIVVDGTANDSLADNGYTVEMKINLDSVGVNVNNPEGDVIELNFSIWDKDVFAGHPLDSYVTRTWWESPWTSNSFDEGRVMVNPNVTVNSGPVPDIGPDVIVPNAGTEPDPVIDGVLDESEWSGAYSFDMAWDIGSVRDSYPGVGPYRSGRFQPNNANGLLAPVLDPVTAKIKMFFKGAFLYLAADVNDKLVQAGTDVDNFDGVTFRIGDRTKTNGDHITLFQQLNIAVSNKTDTTYQALDYLPNLLDSSATEVALKLKGTTTVDNSSDVDEGYVIEMKVDLTGLGYQTGLGDHLLFMGVRLEDADSFDDPNQNYGTRVWWFGENFDWATAWMVMDPNTLVGVNDEKTLPIPTTLELLGNYPNPFNPTTKIAFSLPKAGDVNLAIYNILGQQVADFNMKNLSAGSHQKVFDASLLSSGVYLYSITLKSNNSKQFFHSKVGKMVLMK